MRLQISLDCKCFCLQTEFHVILIPRGRYLVFLSSKPAKDSEYGVSRGIDFKLVSNVLNFDFPLTATRYVHRVGRTARADQMGTAISFVNTTEEARLSDVANFLLQKDPSTLQSNKSDRTAGNCFVFL